MAPSKTNDQQFAKGSNGCQEWSGGAPHRRVGWRRDKSRRSIATIATMGIDIGENSFRVIALERRAIALRHKWSRASSKSGSRQCRRA
jgi:hypothetical protein